MLQRKSTRLHRLWDRETALWRRRNTKCTWTHTHAQEICTWNRNPFASSFWPKLVELNHPPPPPVEVIHYLIDTSKHFGHLWKAICTEKLFNFHSKRSAALGLGAETTERAKIVCDSRRIKRTTTRRLSRNECTRWRYQPLAKKVRMTSPYWWRTTTTTRRGGRFKRGTHIRTRFCVRFSQRRTGVLLSLHFTLLCRSLSCFIPGLVKL